jgi:nitrous oxidase accessory protein NosD
VGGLLTASRSILTVSPTEADCYRRIGDAVAAAGNGDVISIQPGTYAESVVLDREVTLSAAGAAGGVRIESRADPAIVVIAEVATISGVTVRHAGAGGRGVPADHGMVVRVSASQRRWRGPVRVASHDCGGG